MRHSIYKFIGLMLSISILNCNFCYAQTNANTQDSNIKIESKSAVLMEADTGKVLFEYNAHEKLRPASVTKIMTLLLAYDAIKRGDIGLDDTVTISKHASSFGGSTIFLETNEHIKLKLLIKGMSVASGNDAAIATAEYVAGSEQAFVEKMNQKAQQLGMKDTTFINPCGLDADGHLTSAYDVVLMSRELILKHPEILEYTKIWNDKLTHQRKKGTEDTDLTNTNKLIKFYKGMTGLKTGYTSKAKYSLSATAERNGLKLIAVAMGAETKDIRTKDIVKLLDYGFANYQMITEKKAGKVVSSIDVIKGQKNKAECIIKDDLRVLFKKNIDQNKSKIESKIEMDENVNAPVKKGQKIGEIKYYIGDIEISKGDIIINENIEKATLKNMLKKLMSLWF